MVLIIFHDFAQANKHALRKASLWVSHLKKHLRNSNMIQFRVKNLFNLLNYIVYTVFICIAFYLIHQGDIVQRFQQKRTNFAEYSEKVRQLPTIVTWIQYLQGVNRSQHLKYGEDYFIRHSEHPWIDFTTLKLGKNTLKSLHLKIEEKYDYFFNKKLKIIPKKYTICETGLLNHEYKFTYVFTNKTYEVVSGVKISLSPKNNSLCGYGWNNQDGLVPEVFAKPGEHIKTLIKPEKIVFSRDTREKCRREPYNDQTVKKVAKVMSENCTNPCRSLNYWICSHKLESLLPVCQSDIENACFWNTWGKVEKEFSLKPMKPCTVFQYSVQQDSTFTHNLNEAEFEIAFTKPPKVFVKEEYLIYDMMTMIGALGGTLGLCVGFSFTDGAKLIFKYLELGFYRFYLGKSKIGQVNESPQTSSSLEMRIDAICKSNETLREKNTDLTFQLKNLMMDQKKMRQELNDLKMKQT